MCIAIAKQAGVAILEDILETCFDNNPDGAGFCVENEDGSFTIEKGFFTFESFYTAFSPHQYKKALIHFRIKTHGKINQNNCHPFEVDTDTVFIHNGIISAVTANKDKSDTRVFKEEILRPLLRDYGSQILTEPYVKTMIENFIGSSKLAFMRKGEEDFLIFNERLGNYSKEGIWFSNLSWRSKPKHEPVPAGPWSNPSLPSPTRGDTSRHEVPKFESYSGNVFCFGTLVRTFRDLDTKHGIIPKGTLGEVIRVFSDRTVDVEFYHPAGKIENLYTFALEVPDELSCEEWGQLGIGV